MNGPPSSANVPATPRQERNMRELLPALRRVARRTSYRYRGALSADELESIGYLGLQQAARTFDPGRGVPFAGFAWSRIHGAMLTALRKETVLQRGAREAAYKATTQWRDEGDVFADNDQLNRKRLDEYAGAVVAAMVCGVVGEATARAPQQDEALTALSLKRLTSSLHVGLPKLREDKRLVIDRHYFAGVSLKDIGAELGVSYSTVRRLHQQALKRLAWHMKRGDADDDNAGTPPPSEVAHADA